MPHAARSHTAGTPVPVDRSRLPSVQLGFTVSNRHRRDPEEFVPRWGIMELWNAMGKSYEESSACRRMPTERTPRCTVVLACVVHLRAGRKLSLT